MSTKMFFARLIFISAFLSLIGCGGRLSDVARTPLPPPRMYSEMVYDSNTDKIIMFAGMTFDGDVVSYMNDLWAYDGTSWEKLEPENAPSPRFGHAMVYDKKRKTIVLFGGDSASGWLADVWEFYEGQWHEQNDGPGKRAFPIMVYDPTRQAPVMMVGTQRDDMWSFDGRSWQPMEGRVPPPIRFSVVGQAVFDESDQRLLLHSAIGETYVFQEDGWQKVVEREFCGSLSNFEMIYDTERKVAVIFGGELRNNATETCENLGPQNATWEYDGQNWRKIDTAQSPPPRYGHTLAYDEARGVIVLFGGKDEVGYLNDTWEYDGTTWVQK